MRSAIKMTIAAIPVSVYMYSGPFDSYVPVQDDLSATYSTCDHSPNVMYEGENIFVTLGTAFWGNVLIVD